MQAKLQPIVNALRDALSIADVAVERAETFAKLAKEYSDDLQLDAYNRRETVMAMRWSNTDCDKAKAALKQLRKRHGNYMKLCDEQT